MLRYLGPAHLERLPTGLGSDPGFRRHRCPCLDVRPQQAVELYHCLEIVKDFRHYNPKPLC